MILTIYTVSISKGSRVAQGCAFVRLIYSYPDICTFLLLFAIGVGTAGATGALDPAMLKPRGRKYLLSPTIICQVYLLVDSL